MSWSTRSAISTAAFSVKVRASTSSGRARLDEMRCAMRRVRTVVLPVPAPAMMSSGPSPWTTASCCARDRPSSIRSAAVAVSVDMCGQYARRGRHARSVRSTAAAVRPDERRRMSRQATLHPEAEENLFIRRVRFLVGGQVAPKVTFFFETDNPNLGKTVSGTKNISTGFTVQDAYLEWKVTDAFALDAGLIFIPLCRNCIQSAASLLPIDYGAYSFLHGGPTRSVVGRDTGFMAKGYLAKNRLEYRVGAFQGVRDALSRNPFRSSGHLH